MGRSDNPEALLFPAHDWQVQVAGEFAGELKRRRGLTCVALVHGTKDRLCAQRSAAFSEVIDVVKDFDLDAADANASENLLALKTFEKAHDAAFIWSSIIQDVRRRYRRYSLKRYSYNELLAYMAHSLRVLESLFSRWNILAVVGELTNPVYRMVSEMCRPYLTPVPARFFHRFYFEDDPYVRWEACLQTYRQFMHEGIPEVLREKVASMAREISEAKLRPTYFDAAAAMASKNSPARRFLKLFSLDHVEDIWYDNFIDGRKNPEGIHWSYWLPPRNVARGVQYALRKHWYRQHALDKIPDAEYALFLPNSEPEYTLDGQGWPFADQASLIRSIAESLPVGMLLLVKDHLLMVGARELEFYRKILHLPNVRLVDETVSGQKLARSSRLALTVTGTVALEAVACGVPVIMFGKALMNDLAGVQTVRDIYELPQAISSLLKGNAVDFKKSASAMLAAILHSSYPGRIGQDRHLAPDNNDALGNALETELCRRGIMTEGAPHSTMQHHAEQRVKLSESIAALDVGEAARRG